MDAVIAELKLKLHQNKFPSEESKQCYVDMLHYLLMLDLIDKYGECKVSLNEVMGAVSQLLSSEACFKDSKEKAHYEAIYKRLSRLYDILMAKDRSEENKNIFYD